MPDEAPPKVIKPDVNKWKIRKVVDQDLYDRMSSAWISGMTSKRQLSRTFGIVWTTAARAVDHGWPERGWPALKDVVRKAKLDRAQSLVHAEAVKITFEQAHWDEQVEQSKMFLNTLGEMMDKCREAVGRATFSRTKRVKQEDGTWVEVETAPSATSVAMAMAQVAGAYRNVAQILLDAVDKKIGKVVKGAEEKDKEDRNRRGWMNLTQDQLKHIAEKGTLPEGVDPGQLLGLPAL